MEPSIKKVGGITYQCELTLDIEDVKCQIQTHNLRRSGDLRKLCLHLKGEPR